MKEENDSKVYVLDTNILVEFSKWLPLDLNKVFWLKMEESLQKGQWVLLDVAINEVERDNEGLKKWCDDQKKKGLIKNIDDSHRNRAIEINNLYKMIDETTGKSDGDTYLIAYAEANKLVVFSREGYRAKDTDLYKIPDVCGELKVKVIRRPRIFLEAIEYKN